MWMAALWGGVAGSAVFLGSLAGILVPIKKKWIGVIMAFGTGVLIGAASFELLLDSISEGGVKTTAIGFLVGALVFTIFEWFISRKGGNERKRSKQNPQHSSGLAIFIGTVIDAIPESVIIGISLLEPAGVSWLLVVAIFISNFPEGLSSSIGLKKDGYSNTKILLLWAVVLVLSALSSLSGFVFLENASDNLIALIGAFAAGGVVSMVTAAMMPEAYEEGGAVVGFIASFGLLCSLILTHFQ
ncbi:ZIP family metal transporter [Halobacillus litoralis]|uniref:ZIP family metal transporter n=1 Tax=Halobacillus litoralis TaxID=45668 RepID=UPI001CFE648D|nr:ZIP family metal transporter [Halobacillus litoralis]